jgi:hypothetical protein
MMMMMMMTTTMIAPKMLTFQVGQEAIAQTDMVGWCKALR